MVTSASSSPALKLKQNLKGREREREKSNRFTSCLGELASEIMSKKQHVVVLVRAQQYVSLVAKENAKL